MRKIIEKLGFRPSICVWELTLACNMRCGHCGSRAGEPRPDELPFEDLLRIAGELADLGCRRVTLSGGEPILRKEWPEVAAALVARGVRVNMVSNAWGWTEQTVATAQRAGLTNVCFSLDGLEQTHDQIRKPGSFARVLRAFGHCRDAGLSLASIVTINRKNLDELDAVHDLLVEQGVTMWQPQLSDAMGYQRDNLEWALHPQELPAVEAKLHQLVARSPMQVGVGDNVGFYGPGELSFRKKSRFGFWTGCMAGCQVVGIEANGNVKGCLSQQDSAFIEGNLRHSSLRDIWCRPGSFAYNRDFTVEQLEGFCRTCRYNDICRGGCTCSAHFASGSRFDNPFCVYRALELRQQGVIEDIRTEPLEEHPELPVCQPALR